MKNIFLLTLFFLSLNLAWCGEKEPTPKQTIISPYFGLLPIDYATYSGLSAHGIDKFIGLPIALGLRSEFKDESKISYKLDLNFSYTGVLFHTDETRTIFNEDGTFSYLYGYDFKTTSLRIKCLLGFNYYLTDNEKSQRYLTAGIGYKYHRRMRTIADLPSEKVTYFLEESFLGAVLSSTAMRVGYGHKWTLNDKFALSMEIGIGGGGTPLQFGAEFKL